MKDDPEKLIPPHGGFEHLKTYHLALLIYDVTVRFCNRYIDRKSRTRDQMVQAARSGKQNIGEGSIDSGTSKKSELKLTNIARGSLVELKLDYEDFLRERDLKPWDPGHPALMRFKARRPAILEEVRTWVQDERRRSIAQTRTDTDKHRPNSSVLVVRFKIVRPGLKFRVCGLRVKPRLGTQSLCRLNRETK